MNKISLCITNYNRFAYLFKSFEQVIDDDRIGEIIIVDDCSDAEIFRAIADKCQYLPKVKLFRNDINLAVYENKKVSVSKAKYEYCIVFDSDNVIDIAYLNKIYSVAWNSKIILAPDFAKPVFDYRKFSGVTFRKDNVSKFCYKKMFSTFMNTMNYFVHRDSYLSIWQPKDHIKGADSLYMNYLWLLAGNEIHCLKGLQYFHRVHNYDKQEHGSNYAKYATDSAPQCDAIEKQMSLMR